MLFLLSAAYADPTGDFVGGTLPDLPADLPATWVVDTLTMNRLLDTLLIVALTAAVWGISWGIKKTVLESMQPWMLTSVLLFVFLWGVLDPAFYQFKAVVADETGVTVERYSAEDGYLAWDDVVDVQVRDGNAIPMFVDDTSLVLIGKDGTELAVQRHVVDVETFAALVHDKTGL